jgi:hypothetical protein
MKRNPFIQAGLGFRQLRNRKKTLCFPRALAPGFSYTPVLRVLLNTPAEERPFSRSRVFRALEMLSDTIGGAQ